MRKYALAVVLLVAFGSPVLARDDGRHVNDPLKYWFDHLSSGNGMCCSFADGLSVNDVDWDMQNSHYRVLLHGEWIIVPDSAVVRRNTEEVQGGGNFDVFDELFADDFLDHTPQPGRTPDKAGARELYRALRAAFPDFHADIHWQIADGDRVATYKTYHGTHRGEFLGVPPTGRKIQFETVDVMRVRNGKIAEHWGVANLFSLLQQLGAWPAK
jgi:steroid delta-isomerase-like uncharacterized protein